MLGKGKVLKEYKKSLEKLLSVQKVKVKEIVELSDKTGYRVFLKYRDVNLIELKFLKKSIGAIFGLEDVSFKDLEEGILVISIYKPKEYLSYKKVELSSKELLLGYGEEGYIIANMDKYPHLLISGLSNQGKSRMVRYMLNNLKGKADILVFNGFEDDYKEFILISDLKAIER